MTKDLANIDATRRALDDLNADIQKLTRMYDQLTIYSGKEDIDVLVPLMSISKFEELFVDLKKNNFWCYQGDNLDEIYPYIENFDSIRFAKVNETFPNIEFIPFNNTKKAKFQRMTFII